MTAQNRNQGKTLYSRAASGLKASVMHFYQPRFYI